MNDLAEKALVGLDVARRHVRARPMTAFGAGGLLVSVVVVVAGAYVGAAGPSRPITTWLGLQANRRPSGVPLAGTVLLVATLALVALWLVVLAFLRAHHQPVRRVWGLAVSWAAPFAIGPPLLGTSVYSYASYGLLQRAGHDPYVDGPIRLGAAPIVTAIDPGARGTTSSAGPLGTLLQHLSVSTGGGTALGSVIVLRVLSVLATVAIARVSLDLARGRRARTLALVALNPLVLLYLVSAARLDAVLIALVLAALLAAARRRWSAAVVLVCLGGSVLGQALFLLPAVLVAHVLDRRTRPVWRVLAEDVAAAVVVVAGLGFAVPNGFGWAWTVGRQFAAHTPFSVAGATSTVLSPIVPGASYDDFAIGGRVAAMTAMVCTIGYLLVTSRQRPLTSTFGYVLLAVGLLSPVLYPWYLLWGALCLLPRGTDTQRVAAVGLMVAGTVLVPAGYGELTAGILTAILLMVVAALTAGALYLARVAEEPAGEDGEDGDDDDDDDGDGSARDGDDPRPAPRDRRDVARLGAFGRAGRRDVDAL